MCPGKGGLGKAGPRPPDASAEPTLDMLLLPTLPFQRGNPCSERDSNSPRATEQVRRNKIRVRTLPHLCPPIDSGSPQRGGPWGGGAGARGQAEADEFSLPHLQKSEAKGQRRMGQEGIAFILLGSLFLASQSHSSPTCSPSLEPIPEEGRVGSWGGASRLFLWVPGPPSPARGPSSRRGRGAGGRVLCSLPSAVLAAPEIKINCGLGRGSGGGGRSREPAGGDAAPSFFPL